MSWTLPDPLDPRKTLALTRLRYGAPMKKANAAAIYARISSDQTGEGLGVQRQLEDCRNLAAQRGWVVGDEYVDNDISAFSGKARPNYERMLADIADGRVDAVLVYHLDRLTRRPAELEHFIDVCTTARVDVTTVTGDVGLGNDNGLMIARITSAMAAAESGRKSARIKRKHLQNAAMGKPHGGAQRPFGFEPDRVTIRPAEARIIRRLVTRFLAGESLHSLAKWMNEKGIPTTGTAPEWQVQVLRPILRSGRIAGIREHHGQPAGKAVWPAIISKSQHSKVVAMLEAKRRPRTDTPRQYLLTGVLRCGNCGYTLHSRRNSESRRYGCTAGPGRKGCGRVSINAAHIEDWVVAAVLNRLDSPELVEMLFGKASLDGAFTAEVAAIERTQAKMLELAQMFGAGDISRPEFEAARTVAESQRDVAIRRLDRATGTNALEGLSDRPDLRVHSWRVLSLERQRQIVAAMLHHVVIQSRPRGIRKFDETRVEPCWHPA